PLAIVEAPWAAASCFPAQPSRKAIGSLPPSMREPRMRHSFASSSRPSCVSTTVVAREYCLLCHRNRRRSFPPRLSTEHPVRSLRCFFDIDYAAVRQRNDRESPFYHGTYWRFVSAIPLDELDNSGPLEDKPGPGSARLENMPTPRERSASDHRLDGFNRPRR